MKERKPIFYDAERARWRLTRRVMEITGALLTLLLAYFFVTIVVSVELPAGLLPDIKPAFHALKSSKKKPITVREGPAPSSLLCELGCQQSGVAQKAL